MIKKAILVGFILRLVVAVWNGFFGPSFAADLDAQTMHNSAVLIAENLDSYEFAIGTTAYTNVLGTVYHLWIASLFLGSVLSCVAWLGSAGLVIKIMRLLSFDKARQFRAMLIYALLPSSIMFTAVTLREPYELLFVNLAIYAILRLYLYKAVRQWLTLMVAIAGAGALHGGLLAFGILLFAATLLLVSTRGKAGISWVKLVVMAPVAAVALGYGVSFFERYSYNLADGVGSAIEGYQQSGLNADGRAFYKSAAAISGGGDLLLLVPVSLFQYLFEPFPWHVSAASDLVLVLENILRGWLIWKACVGLWKMSTQVRRPGTIVFACYLMVETIWALGTVNWGTAARHHIPGMGLLIIAAFAYSRKTLSKPAKPRAGRLSAGWSEVLKPRKDQRRDAEDGPQTFAPSVVGAPYLELYNEVLSDVRTDGVH